MEFKWSNEQQELFQTIVGFATKQLNDNLIENDRNGFFDRQAWQQCGKFGIQGLPVPEEYGGLGLDALTTVGALEKLGYGCRDNGLVFSINAQMWTVVMPLLAFGSQEQKSRYLPGLCRGDLIGGNAMSEPNSGSDAFSLRTVAEKKNAKYILNGSKTYVTNGPIADVLLVFATMDRSQGPQAITAFLVDKDSPGLQVARKLEKMGLRTSPMSEVYFDDCEVPEENRLGKEGGGTTVFNHSMGWERGCILANAVGSMQRLLENCIQFAKQRSQFGQTIGKFQLVATKIVDMKMRLESARQMLYYNAWLRSLGKTAVLESAMTKLHVSECWVNCCQDAIQIHGGSGYMTEFEIEREMRDALASRLYSGTNEMQRMIIAGMLGL